MMSFFLKIKFQEHSKYDFDEAKHYYKTQEENLYKKFKYDLEQSLNRILSFPNLYPNIDTNIKKCVLNKFPYTILYTIKNDTIYILAIANHHKNPKEYKNRCLK